MRLIAAIPNYNGSSNLLSLISALKQENFDEIFVLDDASTDDTRTLLQQHEEAVTAVFGAKNKGPGGNRNRILPYLKPGDIIYFIDADMELLTSGFREQLLKHFSHNTDIGIIGGLIFTKNNLPMTYNYGYFANYARDTIGAIIEKISYLLPAFINNTILIPIAKPFTRNLDIRYCPPTETIADWVSEANCFISGDLFSKLGGFNETLRYHEGQEFARRAIAHGQRTLFWPLVHCRHLEYSVRKHRIIDKIQWRVHLK